MLLLFVLLVALFGYTTPGYARSYTPEEVPNVKLKDRTQFVSDPEHLLSSSELAAVNAKAQELQDSLTVEVAIVILPAIDSSSPEDFSERLFSHWRIGKAKDNNGLLILYVYDEADRFLRFETGYGLEGALPDGLAYQIQQREMIPLIKEGRVGDGLVAGLNAIQQALTEGYEPHESNWSTDDNGTYSLWRLYLRLNLIFIPIVLLIYAFSFKSTPPRAVLGVQDQSFNRIIPLLAFFPLSILAALPLMVYGQSRARKRVDKCPKCKSKGTVTVLTGKEVEPYLDTGQVVEQRIGSRKYAHGSCSHCDYRELAYKRVPSGYSKCPKCGYYTYHHVGTYKSGFSMIYDKYECVYCHHQDKVRRSNTVRAGAFTGGAIGGSIGRHSGGGFGGGGSWGGGLSGGGGATSRF